MRVLRRSRAHGLDAGGEMPCPAIAQIVTIDAGDHHVFQLHGGDGARQLCRFVCVRRQRLAVADIAERAAARAQVAEDHESGGAVAEAFADIGAGGFLAHGVQVVARAGSA